MIMWAISSTMCEGNKFVPEKLILFYLKKLYNNIGEASPGIYASKDF